MYYNLVANLTKLKETTMDKTKLTVKTLTKYDWIMDTMNRYKVLNLPIDPELIQAVFNIPLTDAKIVLQHYHQGE
jgi:hypothetical protein